MLLYFFVKQSFLMQRICNIIILLSFGVTLPHKIIIMIPYAVIMCSINILSSYCLTVMPLASFMAFKKLIVFFVLIIAIIMNRKPNFTLIHYFCIIIIILGGVMVGLHDFENGNINGHISSLIYSFLQALSLQYSNFLYLSYSIQPTQIFLINSILSLPFYVVLIIIENESYSIYQYLFVNQVPQYFTIAFAGMLIFACLSELAANFISMKISPFQKATVSNIKDIILALISVLYFGDFIITLISQLGLLICLLSSLFLSILILQLQQPSQEINTSIINKINDQQQKMIENQILDQQTAKNLQK